MSKITNALQQGFANFRKEQLEKEEGYKKFHNMSQYDDPPIPGAIDGPIPYYGGRPESRGVIVNWPEGGPKPIRRRGEGLNKKDDKFKGRSGKF